MGPFPEQKWQLKFETDVGNHWILTGGTDEPDTGLRRFALGM